jgi:hypothetical protein
VEGVFLEGVFLEGGLVFVDSVVEGDGVVEGEVGKVTTVLQKKKLSIGCALTRCLAN